MTGNLISINVGVLGSNSSGINDIDEKLGQTMAVLDNNNFATKYVYDDAGRVRVK
jgi:YD repeat-containing protein